MSHLLNQLGEAGQAVWLDFLSRDFLNNGGLKKLIDEDGLTGVTSNPAIFDRGYQVGSGYAAACL